MTSKERMFAAIEGRKPDCFPVAAPYLMLSNADHWVELTGLPVWKFYEWSISTDLDWHTEMYKVFYEKLPFDIVQPWWTPSRESRENTKIVLKDGIAFYYYKKEDRYEKVPDTIHESGSGGGENETRLVFNKKDAKEKIRINKAEHMIKDGCNDYLEALIKAYGDSRFIVNTGIVNTFYSNVYYLGMTEFYAMLYEEPELIKYMSELLLEQNIETIRAAAAAGGDAIFIDDATATSDMVSPKTYEEFSLPYLTQEVKEIQRLGKKAILIYFGGISDRLDMIASTGADVLMMETSMKSFTNDLETVMKKVGDRMCVSGNLNPYDDIEITSGQELSSRIAKQLAIGRKYGGKFFSSTGSPLTPGTSVERLRRFIDLAHNL
jgi:uroporphyrinogen-III decarboxylase